MPLIEIVGIEFSAAYGTDDFVLRLLLWHLYLCVFQKITSKHTKAKTAIEFLTIQLRAMRLQSTRKRQFLLRNIDKK